MKMVGTGNETYILLSGIAVSKSVELSDNIQLQSADTSHLDLETTLAACTKRDDIAVAAAFIPRISAQLQIKSPTPETLAATAWNASWDILLLSALFRTEIGFNLQSDVAASAISKNSSLRATNLHMRGLTAGAPYQLTSDDSQWITHHYANARLLLRNERFQTAVHCLATYRWHSMPRVQMAILWAGIEGMFWASSEIRFRISLYVSRFLYSENKDQRKMAFDAVKKLYDSRSAAVHGSKIKGDTSAAVLESAELLWQLLRRCVEQNALPDESELAP